MLLLSGPPTYGRGSVVAPKPPPRPKPQVTLQPLLLDPVFPELTAWTTSETDRQEEQRRRQPAQLAAEQQAAAGTAAGEEQAEEEAGRGGEVRIDLQHAAPGGKDGEVRLGVPSGVIIEGLASIAMT